MRILNCNRPRDRLIQIFLINTLWIVLARIVWKLVTRCLRIGWLNCCCVMINVNSNCWIAIRSKRDFICGLWISDVPTSWNIVLSLGWNRLISMTIDLIMTNWITIFVDIGYGCLLSIWCVSNLNRSKTTISSYLNTINFSLTWCVAGNYWCIVFIELTCSPIAILGYFTSHFINCSGSG